MSRPDPNVVDREALKRIYAKFDPAKTIKDIDEIILKRKGDRAAMKAVFEHLGGRFTFDALALRASVEKELAAKASGGAAAPASPAGAKKATSPAPATAATKQPAAPAAASPAKAAASPQQAASPTRAAGGAAAGASAFAGVSPRAGSPPSSVQPGGGAAVAAVGGAASAALGNTLEAQTVARVARLLARDDPSKAANAEGLVRALHQSKTGLTEKSASQLVKSLEKRLGYTEADVGGAPVPGAVAAIGGPATPRGRDLAPGGMGAAGAAAATHPSGLKPSIAQLLHDGFGVAPDQRTVALRREPMTAEERAYYEQLFLPSVKMACADSGESPQQQQQDVQDALDEIFKRCESSVLPQRMAAEARTARDVADRVLRSMQAKYELRNPAGRNDFFAKFIPGSASQSRHIAQQQQKAQQLEQQRSAAARGVTGSGFSLDSSPMAVSRLIAQNTLASSMLSAAQFLGADDEMAAAEARLREAVGATVSDLGPLPAAGDGRSFTAMLTSAMKFLDSSSAAAADPGAALAAGGGGLPRSDKEVLHATFVVEFLQWDDVSACPEARRERFKLAVAQDVAEVLGWGELFEGGASVMPFSGGTVGTGSFAAAGGVTSGAVLGRHSWRNVIVRKFSLSTAGNVHAECSIIVPAGISVDDLQSLVYARLRTGGFPMLRARVSLARDLEARPAKLYCRTASFSAEREMRQEPVVPIQILDAALGVNVSPHRDLAMQPRWPVLPVSP